MKQLKTKIIANDKVGVSFYRMKLGSGYLAKTAKPGQFIEVRCTAGVDPLLRRPLGVHRITKSGIEVLYQVVGKGTELLSAQKAGRFLDVIGPLGNGFDIAAAGSAILIGGGIGVAPLVALAEELGDAHVIIGARTKSHVLCENEFKRLGLTVSVVTEDGSKGHKGLATDLLKDALQEMIYPAPEAPDDPLPEAKDDRIFQRNIQIYTCGPTGMLKAVARLAASYSIRCQVSLEERMACGVGVCLGCPVKVRSGGYKMVCKDGPVFNAEDVAW